MSGTTPRPFLAVENRLGVVRAQSFTNVAADVTSPRQKPAAELPPFVWFSAGLPTGREIELVDKINRRLPSDATVIADVGHLPVCSLLARP